MKKISRASRRAFRDRDGHDARRSSQGGENTDGHQSEGATTATGGSQASIYTYTFGGGYQPQRGAGGNQGTRRGGGSDRPRDQEYTAAGQDMSPHMKSTVASQSRQVKIDVTTAKKPNTSAPKVCIKCFVYFRLCVEGFRSSFHAFNFMKWSPLKYLARPLYMIVFSWV